MAKINFNFQNIITTILCNDDDIFKDIYNKFLVKINKNIKDLYLVYDGKIIDENSFNLKYNEIINNNDKIKNEMNILVDELNENRKINNLIQSKEIICPECGENIKINIKNYKIILYECKNKHTKILKFNEFNKSQNIDESKIICKECEKSNKSETYENQFYKCNTCHKNICPICKNHHKLHNIIDYNLKNYICEEHNEKYIAYCNNCKKNICSLCDHSEHKIEYYKLPKIENKKNEIKELRNKINKMNEEINKIIEIINDVKNNIEEYYNICNNIINNYDLKNRNYENLNNIEQIINKDIINDINKIITDNNINTKFNIIFQINQQLNNKEYIIEHKNTNEKIEDNNKNNLLNNLNFMMTNKKSDINLNILDYFTQIKGGGSGENKFFPKISYKGVSIVDGLDKVGAKTNFEYRCQIATKNGITDYDKNPTPEKNLYMLKLLKEGKLLKP